MDVLDRTPVGFAERGTQRLMPFNELSYRATQRGLIKRTVKPYTGGNVISRTVRRQLIQNDIRSANESERVCREECAPSAASRRPVPHLTRPMDELRETCDGRRFKDET